MHNEKPMKLISNSLTRLIIMLILVSIIFAIFYGYTAKQKEKGTAKRAITVLCAGDSITAAEYPAYLQEMLRKIDKNIFVLNRGIIGNTSGEYLRYMKQTRLVETTEPDYVLLQLGTNDVRIDTNHTSTDEFYKNMDYIIGMFKTHANRNGSRPLVLIATIPPIVVEEPFYFDKESARRVVNEINPAIVKLAQENQCPVVDNYKLFTGNLSLLPDIHPNDAGYKALAENWFKALQPYL